MAIQSAIDNRTRLARALEHSAFALLLMIVVLRPLVAETYDAAGTSIARAIEELSEPSPVRTLVFDLLILLSAVFVAAARAIRPSPGIRYRSTGLEWGAAILAVAAVLSCVTAGNKRLAVNATIDWLCLPLLAMTLIQVLHSPFRRRLMLAGVLASACVQALICFDQYFITHADTVAMYEANKAEFWAKQGVEPDSSKVELFERRMLAREASGTLPHSNVAGAYLALSGITALGVVVQSLRKKTGARSGLRPWPVLGAGLCAAIILSAVWLTSSLGAILSLAATLLVGALLFTLRNWITEHRTAAFVLAWSGIAVAGIAVVAHGVHHGGLPGASLDFRWRYWTASAELIRDHWLTGVGRENFGRHYLQYKSIASPEEISNPHNLLVQAAADWGVLGAAGLLVMLVGASWRLKVSDPRTAPSNLKSGTSHSRSPIPDSKSDISNLKSEISNSRAQTGTSEHSWLSAIGLCAIVMLGRCLLSGSRDANLLYVIAVLTALPWLIGFAAVFVASSFWKQAPESERSVGPSPSQAADSPGVGFAAALGLFAFLLHETINFALFVPATATTVFAVFAMAFAERSEAVVASPPVQGESRRRRRPIAVAAATVALLATGVILAVPVANSARWMWRARDAEGAFVRGLPIERQNAYLLYQAAAQADSLDPTPLQALSEWLRRVYATTHDPQVLDKMIEALNAASSRDPFNVQFPRRLAEAQLARGQRTGNAGAFSTMLRSSRRALDLYPRDPHAWVTHGSLQLAAAKVMSDPSLAAEAIESLQHALTLDDARPSWETIRRFRDRERQEIGQKIAEAKALRSKSN